jgi:hypothetical protein
MFIKNYVSLYPVESLIINNGHDGKGTHGDKTRMFETKLGFWSIKTPWPNPVEDVIYKNQLHKYFQLNLQMPKQNLFQKAKSKLINFKDKNINA